jgi:hypothetical protein
MSLRLEFWVRESTLQVSRFGLTLREREEALEPKGHAESEQHFVGVYSTQYIITENLVDQRIPKVPQQHHEAEYFCSSD